MKLTFTVVLSSPLERAKQTAEIATRQFPSVKIQTLEHLLSNSDPENLFRELQSFSRDSRVLIVSHEPFVSRCIASLISAGSEPKISIKKAALSCVEVGLPVQRGAGVLLWLITSEQMRLMRI
jgi:phosphohistidine phosphatase SixA